MAVSLHFGCSASALRTPFPFIRAPCPRSRRAYKLCPDAVVRDTVCGPFPHLFYVHSGCPHALRPHGPGRACCHPFYICASRPMKLFYAFDDAFLSIKISCLAMYNFNACASLGSYRGCGHVLSVISHPYARRYHEYYQRNGHHDAELVQR